jgi:hypothetical protein
MPLGFQDVTGPGDRPRRPHEFDFHDSEFLRCFPFLRPVPIISGLGDLIKGVALSLSNLLFPEQSAFSFRIPHSEFRIFDLSA